MKSLFATIALAFSPLAAHAANIACDGSYFGYNFHITARSQGTHINSKIKVVVTSSGDVVKSMTMTPTSSQILENQSLAATGTGDDATGELNASYSGGNSYKGTLDAHTSSGSASVGVTCSLSPSIWDGYWY
jgi:hypothetical protein